MHNYLPIKFFPIFIPVGSLENHKLQNFIPPIFFFYNLPETKRPIISGENIRRYFLYAHIKNCEARAFYFIPAQN